MVWYAWVLVSLYVVGALATIYLVGKPRKPITPGVAVSTTVFNSLYIYLVVLLATNGGPS